jgi:hypothetical protein
MAAVTHHSAEFHNIKYQLLQSNPVLEGTENHKDLTDLCIPVCFFNLVNIDFDWSRSCILHK